MAQPYAAGGDGEAGERGAVFEQDDATCGSLRPPHRRQPAEPAAPGVKLAHRDRPRRTLEQEGDGEHHIVDRRIAKRLGIPVVNPAFVDGNAGSDGKDEDYDDERPEIKFGAVAEGV